MFGKVRELEEGGTDRISVEKERVIISDKSESQKDCSQKQLDGFQVMRMNTDKVTEFSSLNVFV